MKKRLFLIIVLAAALSAALGACYKDTTFSGAGVTVVLDSSFSPKLVSTVDYCLESRDHLFTVTKSTKSAAAEQGIGSLEHFTQAVLTSANKISAVIVRCDDQPYVFYYAFYSSIADSANGIDYGYMLAAFEGAVMYYTINFCCLLQDLEGNKDLYLKWAKSITVE